MKLSFFDLINRRCYRRITKRVRKVIKYGGTQNMIFDLLTPVYKKNRLHTIIGLSYISPVDGKLKDMDKGYFHEILGFKPIS